MRPSVSMPGSPPSPCHGNESPRGAPKHPARSGGPELLGLACEPAWRLEVNRGVEAEVEPLRVIERRGAPHDVDLRRIAGAEDVVARVRAEGEVTNDRHVEAEARVERGALRVEGRRGRRPAEGHALLLRLIEARPAPADVAV